MPQSGQINPDDFRGGFQGPLGTDPNGAANHYGAAQLPSGPLAHTPHDECWEMVRGTWLDANTIAGTHYSLIQTMPYRRDQAHRQGRTTLGLVTRCASPDLCPTLTVTVRVGTGIWHRPDGLTHLDAATPLNRKTVTIPVPGYWRPERWNIIPIAEIDALGYCRTADGQDCGT